MMACGALIEDLVLDYDDSSAHGFAFLFVLTLPWNCENIQK
jgi:hypothetical protein